MQSKMHTIWLTTFTLIAILLSSVASSTPLMPLKMAVANQITISNEKTMASDSNDSHCSSAQEIAPVAEPSCCDSEQMHSDHQCCPASCVTSFSIIVDSEKNYIQPFSLILISKEPHKHISSIASALYKPPIA